MDFAIRNIIKKYKRYVEENSANKDFAEFMKNIEKDIYKNHILVTILGKSNYFIIYVTIYFDKIELVRNFDGYYVADRKFNLCIYFSEDEIIDIVFMKDKGRMGIRPEYDIKIFSKEDMTFLKQIYSFTKNSLVKEYIEILKGRIK